MEKYLPILKKSYLFMGMTDTEIINILKCLSSYKKSYIKNSFISRIGDILLDMGMVIYGSIHLIKEDYWGNRTIIAKIENGQVFGETYACLESEPLNVSIIAAENTEILFMNIKRILTICTSACNFHSRLISNLLKVIASKNLDLTNKVEHISKRTTREKLLSYLSQQAQKNKSNSFEIPFNRQQLADYLSVDRSAMSNELCKMRDQGILQFNRNKFKLYDNL